MQKMRHSVLTSDLTGKWKAWPDLSTDMYLLLVQGRLYQLAMLAVSAIDTQRVSVRYKTCQLLLRNYIDKLYELSAPQAGLDRSTSPIFLVILLRMENVSGSSAWDARCRGGKEGRSS